MAEETNMKEVFEEIKGASEDEQLKDAIEKWYQKIHTQSMKIGATYISAAIYGVTQKHLRKKAKPSLRDYERCVDEIIQIISVQLTKQNDSEEIAVKENENDRTAESDDNTNS